MHDGRPWPRPALSSLWAPDPCNPLGAPSVQVEELKRDYYHRKNRRERWEEYHKAHPSSNMDYRGWELFEDDPDEDLWNVTDAR